MKFVHNFASIFLITALCSSTVFANDNILNGSYDYKPDIQNEKNLESFDKKAWVTDVDGNVTEVVPVDFNLRLPSGYSYSFNAYNQNAVYNNNTKFYVGEVSVYNGSNTSGTLQYRQGSTESISWDVEGSVSANAEFGNAFLGSIEGSVGVSVGREATSYKSNTVEYSTTVKPYSNKTIKKYHKGHGSGGVVIFKRYDGSGNFAGYYSEESSNFGWVPALNKHSFTVHDY